MGLKVTSQTAHGPVDWYYVLSTPSKTLATPEELNRHVPTVLVLVPGFSLLVSAHPQFRDPGLRRFNLITLDYLGHGKTEGEVPERYRVSDVAADIASFLEAVNLPPVIVLGFGMGGRFATQLAINFPEKVLGLFLVSTRGGVEPPAVVAGRTQVFELWAGAVTQIGHGEASPEAEELLESVRFGVNQLAWGAWNSGPNPTCFAMGLLSFNAFRRRWDHAHIRAARTFSLDMAVESNFTSEQLKRVKIPVELAYGLADVGYTPEQYEKFASDLRDAGVTVRRVTPVEGAPNFLSTTHAHVLNPMVAQFVDALWTGDAAPEVTPPHGRRSMHTPFEDDLKSVGWEDEDEESVDETEHV